MNYLDHGYRLIANAPESRTIRSEVDGAVFWIKRAVPPKANAWHALQKIFACLLCRPIFRVTASKGGGAALRLEATRIAQFKTRGFHVPEVLAINDDMLALSDLGMPLPDYLDTLADPAARLALLKQAAGELARLHKAGLAHGRPYIRDMTWDGERIGFLDLEDDPAPVMPLSAAQARDLWLFSGAAARFARGQDRYTFDPAVLEEIYNAYTNALGAVPPAELRALVNFINPAGRAIERFFWRQKFIGKDVRQAVFATRVLHKQLN